MREDVKKVFDILFEPGEEVVASSTQYATSSIPQDQVDEDNSEFIVINPVKGWRVDANCTALRSFMIEVDDMPLDKQFEYIHSMGMPYSIAIYSGNKSFHFIITLDKGMPDLKSYKFVGAWLAAIMDKADPQPPKVPTRGLRFPGHIRKQTGRVQKLIEAKGRVKREDFNVWINKYEHLRPEVKPPRPRAKNPDYHNLDKWIKDELESGIDETKGRNNRWFSVAYGFYLAGYEQEDAIAILESHFQPDWDFTRHEWEACIRHAYKKASQSS